jgi:flagellar biogenesis protein FliO
MQLKYNRQASLGSSIIKTLIKLLLLIVVFIFVIFLIEKVNFPSPEKKYKIDITDEIKKL